MIGIRTERIGDTGKKVVRHRAPIEDVKIERIAPRKLADKVLNQASSPSSSKATAIGVAMSDKFPWTTDTLASELGMPVNSFRAWKIKAEKDGKIKKPAVGSLLCIVDPNQKGRHLYSDAYLDKLKAARGNVMRKAAPATSSMGLAKLKVTVPVFDEVVANFLLRKFSNEKGLEDHLRTYLIDLARPTLSKMEELRKRHEREMAELLETT